MSADLEISIYARGEGTYVVELRDGSGEEADRGLKSVPLAFPVDALRAREGVPEEYGLSATFCAQRAKSMRPSKPTRRPTRSSRHSFSR
jgi:hypothetical protein